MKKILIVTTAFYPENAVGSVRVTKLAKYLRKNNYDITVISPKISTNTLVDDTLFCKEISDIKKYNVDYSEEFKSIFLKKRDDVLKNDSASGLMKTTRKGLIIQLKAKLFSFAYTVYTAIKNHDWEKKVLEFVEKNIDIREYDVLLSSYPSISSHNIAYRLKKKNPKIKWIADFRDPIYYGELNRTFLFNFREFKQQIICSRANYITYVSKEMVKKLSTKNKETDKFHYISNGFDIEDFDSLNLGRKKDEKYAFTYVGNLYGGKRDLSIFFQALSELIKESILKMENLKFNYAGKDFSILVNQAKKFSLEKILINHGYVTRGESLELQKESDLILVSTWNTKLDRGVIPGKVYECFLLKKPTIVITSGDEPFSELGSIVQEAKLGIEINTMQNILQELNQIKKYLIEIKAENREVNQNYINQFEYGVLAKKMIKIIEE